MFILAKLLCDTGQPEQAEVWFRRIAQVDPNPRVLDQLARLCFQDERRWSDGAEYSRRAWEAMPEDEALGMHWAWSLVRTGRIEEGVQVLGWVVALNPESSEALATHLWFLHYLDHSRRQIADGYREWARRFAPSAWARQDHSNDPDPDRRLRIGYLSPDFRRHAAAYAIEVTLDGHDRRQVEVFGYGNVAKPDRMTEHLTAKLDRYRDIHGQSAQVVADQIRQDGIDILVEIGGHVTDSRMDVLALKPAPLQGDLGGISTTGMSQIDFRLTDAVLDPPEELGSYVEQLLYLPGGQLCFRPPSESPPVEPLPARHNGYLTFGSVNSNPKINPGCITLWSRVLRQIPTSRMVLKFRGGADVGIQAYYRRQFESHGVAGERIEIVGHLPFQEYLGLFHRLDLLLDTHPYNGCITTLEGLWMGVPILTLTGQTFVSRMGLSILKRLGLEVFAASSTDGYVAKVHALTAQIDALAQIRQSLRAMMLASPLCDPGRMGRELEQAYRSLWRTWCQWRANGSTSVTAERQGAVP